MKWIMELKLDGKWAAVRQKPDAEPYQYDTPQEASRMLEICYPDLCRDQRLSGGSEQLVRVRAIGGLPMSRVTIGRRVRALRSFANVPEGTEGVIDQLYQQANDAETIMVAWDLPHRPLPEDWKFDVSDPACWQISPSCPLRDGFGVPNELQFLEEV